MTAKMFIWRSRLLANYGPGHIIVVASNVEEARRFASLEVANYIEQRAKDFCLDEDEVQRLRHVASMNLVQDPEQVMSLLIRGSE